MCTGSKVTINLSEIRDSSETFEFQLGDQFFSALDQDLIEHGRVGVVVCLSTPDHLNFSVSFKVKGEVEVPCDLCLAPMAQAVEAESSLVAVVGAESSDDDDLVAVPQREPLLDLSWLIYEQIALAIPLKHVHKPGACTPEMTQILQEFTAARSGQENGESTDPRWEALRGAITEDED